MACEDPSKYELPFSHWTPQILQIEVIKANIVDNISIRQIARFLKERDLKPHRVQSWLNPKIEDIEQFQEQVAEICKLYHSAEDLSKEGTIIYSSDEKMGVKAREHINPKQTMEPGQVERVDPEYKRHGTSGIIASRDVVTGEIVEPMMQPTRTEADFLKHIKLVFSQNPENKHIFLTDCLNTHMSESLVKYVAEIEEIDEAALGIKGKTGILKNMKSRAEFLNDAEHQVQFVYTPKHCSWLNQIECWFSGITRNLLNRRASFGSIEELEQKIKSYIKYYNQYFKKAYQWKYKGKILRV